MRMMVPDPYGGWVSSTVALRAPHAALAEQRYMRPVSFHSNPTAFLHGKTLTPGVCLTCY